jgi:hypothetical protein
MKNIELFINQISEKISLIKSDSNYNMVEINIDDHLRIQIEKKDFDKQGFLCNLIIYYNNHLQGIIFFKGYYRFDKTKNEYVYDYCEISDNLSQKNLMKKFENKYSKYLNEIIKGILKYEEEKNE